MARSLKGRTLLPLPAVDTVQNANSSDRPASFADEKWRLSAELCPPWASPGEEVHSNALPTTARRSELDTGLTLIQASLQRAYEGSRHPWLGLVADRYQKVPDAIRLKIFGALRQGPGTSPLRLRPDGVDCWAWRLVTHWGTEAQNSSRWPSPHSFAVCLSHDVDTANGVPGAVRIAALEERFGLRSAFFVNGTLLTRYREIWRDLHLKGFEIGLHGDSHNFAEPDRKFTDLRQRLGAHIERHPELELSGYRSPGLQVSPQLRSALTGLFDYDSSVPTGASQSRIWVRPGCGTIFPFLTDQLLTLPVSGTMDDVAILNRLGANAWVEQIMAEVSTARQKGGLYLLINHTEPHLSGNRLLETYRQILTKISTFNDAWVQTPATVARYCRKVLEVGD